ncbi:MAG: AAA family ATPase [Pirellulales bacterium]
MSEGCKEKLPREPAAERYVLACAIAWPERAGEVLPLLRPADFADGLHERLWRTLQRQHAAGDVDVVLAARECDAAGYVLELAAEATTAAHVPVKAAEVIEARRKRQLAESAEHVLKCCQNGRPAESILYEWKNTFEEIERDTNKPQEQFTLRELRQQYPTLNPPIVDGLFRAGETVNVISHSKAGKSWFAYLLALSIIDGCDFLGRFRTTPGKVLLIDNELHRCTLAYRIPAVADALGIPADAYESELIVWPLRGRLRGLNDLYADLEAIEPDEFQAIIFDSKYRFASSGGNENDNNAETLFYNRADECGERTGAAIVFIHHASKGDQSGKRTTDVGSGAGAQSRAADTHLVLREHEEEGYAVLDAALRSFPPVEPLALRWQFPLWLPASGIDPARLKGRLNGKDQQQAERDREATTKIVDALLKDGPATARQLRPKTGLSRERLQRLLDFMTANGDLETTEITLRGNQCDEYQLAETT